MPSKTLWLTALAALALFIFVLMPQASAQSAPSIQEFKLPNDSTSIDAMTMDSSGNVWLAQSSPAVLYKFDVTKDSFERYFMPVNNDALFKGMSAEGSDYIWMADQQGNQIIGYDVAKNKFYNFTFPANLQLDPSDVIARDNYLYVAMNMELGRINIDTNFLDDYYVDKYDASLSDIVMDRIGNVWFVEYSSGKVGGYYRLDDKVQIFPIPTADSAPTCIDIDSQGRLWFIESGPNKLGMFDTNTNSFSEFDMPVLDGQQVNAKRLAVDGDDNVWITDLAHDRLIKYYPTKNVFVPISLSGGKIYPSLIGTDNDNIWFMESGTASLAELQADPLYGLVATPTPTPTAKPTEAANQTASTTPKPTPGFEIITVLAALLILAKKRPN